MPAFPCGPSGPGGPFGPIGPGGPGIPCGPVGPTQVALQLHWEQPQDLHTGQFGLPQFLLFNG